MNCNRKSEGERENPLAFLYQLGVSFDGLLDPLRLDANVSPSYRRAAVL